MAEGGTPESRAPASAGEGPASGAALEALRDRGAALVDPVRLRFIEALARRAAGHEGETRRGLDDRLARLLSTFRDDLDRSRAAQADAGAAGAERSSIRGALGELVDHIASQAPPAAASDAAQPKGGSVVRPTPPEPEALQYFRRTWSRLSADQRLAQSLSTLPGNAGPLNSHQLVHRSLTSMRELSPGYLERFVAHVDGLLWLELACEDAAGEGNRGARADLDRKGARGRQA